MEWTAGLNASACFRLSLVCSYSLTLLCLEFFFSDLQATDMRRRVLPLLCLECLTFACLILLLVGIAVWKDCLCSGICWILLLEDVLKQWGYEDYVAWLVPLSGGILVWGDSLFSWVCLVFLLVGF